MTAEQEARKDTFYLKHDLDARLDPKTAKMIRVHGWAAYGLFWAIVEKTYGQGGKLPADFCEIAYDLRAEPELIEKIVRDFGLFYVKRNFIGSESIDRRLEERAALRARRAAAGAWGGRAKAAAAGRSLANATENVAGEERRGKEITAAPSAADLDKLTDSALQKRERALLLARMEDARLPFDFGDFKKGGRIMDLDLQSARNCLEMVPRQSLDLRLMLRELIAIKTAERHPRAK